MQGESIHYAGQAGRCMRTEHRSLGRDRGVILMDRSAGANRAGVLHRAARRHRAAATGTGSQSDRATPVCLLPSFIC